MSKSHAPGSAAPVDSGAAEAAAPAQRAGPVLVPAERYPLAVLSAIQGGLFVWAALVLPWQSWTLFAFATAAAGGCHLFTAGACLGRPRFAPRAWRASSASALAVLLLVSWQVFTGGSYLVGLYGSLGEGLFGALLAIWGLFVLLTVPTSVWGIVRTRALWSRYGAKRATALLALGVAVLLGAGCLYAARAPKATALLNPLPAEAFLSVVDAAISVGRQKTAPAKPGGGRKSVRCPGSQDGHTLTLIATHQRGGDLVSYCLQGNDIGELLDQVAARILRWKTASAIKLDLLTGVAPLTVGPPLLAPFRLRPGLDGACLGDRCIAPWQLLSRGAFTRNQPLPFLQDLKFGISETSLRRLLGGAEGALQRVTTQSLSIDSSGQLTPLRRLRPYLLPVTEANVLAATAAAQKHILDAQLKDGKFRYTLQPFTGTKQTKNFNLARQAGTLYAICELSNQSPSTASAIKRGLALLERHEKPNQDRTLSGLVMRQKEWRLRLSNSALPLVAFLACRDRVGARFDGTIQRLAALILSLQRVDGGFYPEFSLKNNQVIAKKEPLYAPGQAILALVLLKKLQISNSELNIAAPSKVTKALQAGMLYIARKHWNHSLYPFLFIEENWHCLAARAALSVHPLREYENFCLDYVRFKSRLILDEDSDVSPEFIGGLGFGNVIPPHNTGAAGFGEALSAAISVKRARNEPIDGDRALLKRVFGFLLRQQWTEQNCFGCAPSALGSLSEHTHSPLTRIDFVQHAWAALGYESVNFDG